MGVQRRLREKGLLCVQLALGKRTQYSLLFQPAQRLMVWYVPSLFVGFLFR